jgi:tRNA-uridine 2-sulfurtransferase
MCAEDDKVYWAHNSDRSGVSQKETMKKKVMVAMSGGVDSSVAAYLLVQKGYEVVGVTMCLGVNTAGAKKQPCAGPKEINDARRVCRILSIPHYSLDFSGFLKEKVIDNFIEEYTAGRTPNPCIQCNRYLKFGALLKNAQTSGFEYLATGHYAAMGTYKGGSVLKKPADFKKDQTYFLYAIPQDALKSIMMPLGDYTKEDVRKIAHTAKLPVAEKPQSQDICFIPGKDYAVFLESKGYRSKPGNIVDKDGTVLGRHKGIVNYTIGQRGGLGISSAQGLYVLDIDSEHNMLIVGERKDLKAAGLVAHQVNLHVNVIPDKVSVKIRLGHAAVPARVRIIGKKLEVIFEEAQESITPGQSAVLYDHNVLLGGGIIEKVLHIE